MTKDDYLKMQRALYDRLAEDWALDHRDPVVGFYDEHNAYPDYDTKLFRGFDTTGMTAVEYGCGPGRNLIRYSPRFKHIIGVDISSINLEKAILNTHKHGVINYGLARCDGEDIPLPDDYADVVFSVICLQHICCHSIRFNIMKEAYRVLKPDGYFCFQMGIGVNDVEKPTAEYFENAYHAQDTNSGYDVVIRNEEDLRGDLEKIGFRNYSSYIGDALPSTGSHKNWFWVQVQK
jgi:ubiquinone/menaquinone biosynthesis C-methylase UbiE